MISAIDFLRYVQLRINSTYNPKRRERTPLRNDIKVMKTDIHKTTTTTTSNFLKMTRFIRYDVYSSTCK